MYWGKRELPSTVKRTANWRGGRKKEGQKERRKEGKRRTDGKKERRRED